MSPTPADPWPRHLPRALSVPATGLAHNLATSAVRYPDKPAIVFYGAAISYAELQRRVARLAGHLVHTAAVKPGDRVLLDAQNSPAFITGLYAILLAGAVAVPVNPMNRTEELRWMVGDSGARVAIAAQDLWPELAPLHAEGLLDHTVLAHYGADLPEQPDPPAPEALRAPAIAAPTPQTITLAEAIERAEPLGDAGVVTGADAIAGGEALALIAYTSGTTGHPKGCMLSHRALQAAAVALSVWNRWHADAVVLATAPFFHVTGMVGSMNLPLLAGATIVLLPRWDRAAAAALMQRHRVTHWTNVPTMVTDLLALPDPDGTQISEAFRSLVYIGGGGTAMPEAVAARLNELTGLEYQEGWGLTEVAGAIHLNPPGGERRQCLGIPIFGVETRVVATDGSSQAVPQGEPGELVTRTPSLFSGYWANPAATEQAFLTIDGQRWFRTGDIGRQDGQGYFYMADRLKRMINASGFKVWPAEVESLLFKHPAVQEACVIGTHDAHRGETVKAVVVLKPGVEAPSVESFIAWCRGHMAAYKVPRQVVYVDALPKSGTGKVMWRQLQEREQKGARGAGR